MSAFNFQTSKIYQLLISPTKFQVGEQFLSTFDIWHSYLLCAQTVGHNAYHQDPYAQEFGIRISNQLANVEARILPAPRVCIFS
jgi:hypothetical protein